MSLSARPHINVRQYRSSSSSEIRCWLIAQSCALWSDLTGIFMRPTLKSIGIQTHVHILGCGCGIEKAVSPVIISVGKNFSLELQMATQQNARPTWVLIGAADQRAHDHYHDTPSTHYAQNTIWSHCSETPSCTDLCSAHCDINNIDRCVVFHIWRTLRSLRHIVYAQNNS